MRHALFTALLIAILPAAAQTAAEPIRLNEQRKIQAASVALLDGAMTFLPDGTVRTTHQVGEFMTRIELKGLKIREIVKADPDANDLQQGATRRYIVKLSCTAHRIWDGPRVAWSEWRESTYGFLPSTLIVEEVNGQLLARGKRIKDFSPGIDATLTASTR